MLITDIIDQRAAVGTLIKFVPLFDADEGEKRQIWLRKQLYDEINRNYKKPRDRDYWASVRAQFGHFVKGHPVDCENFMKPLRPRDEDLWEIKTLFNKAKGRILGAFIYQDCFFAFRHYSRDFLGKRKSRQWLNAEASTIQTWNELFPGVRRYHCWPCSNCITGGVDS